MQPVNMGKLALEEQEQDEKQKPVDGKVRVILPLFIASRTVVF